MLLLAIGFRSFRGDDAAERVASTARQPGGSAVVVSRSSMMTGPAIIWPAASAVRS
jgi:hypothetical protein